MRAFVRFIFKAVYWLVFSLCRVVWVVVVRVTAAALRPVLRIIYMYIAALIFIWGLTVMLQ